MEKGRDESSTADASNKDKLRVFHDARCSEVIRPAVPQNQLREWGSIFEAEVPLYPFYGLDSRLEYHPECTSTATYDEMTVVKKINVMVSRSRTGMILIIVYRRR